MKNSLTHLKVSIILFAFLTTSGFAQLSSDLSDTLTTRFEALFQAQNIKSANAAVFFPDGSVWEHAAGTLGTSTPLTVNHLMEMGSNTKTMVAAAILQMDEEGILSINDTLYKHIPKIQHVPSGITIKQLLNHTSGLYDYSVDPDLISRVNSDPYTIIPLDSVLTYLKPPTFAAGTDFEYCNTNYFILGLVCEAVDGKPFHQVLRDRFFTLLQLDETYLDVYESYSLPKAGTWLAGGTFLGNPFDAFLSVAWAAGAILATPADLAEWAYHLYFGNVLEDSSLIKMQTTLTLNGTPYNYGLGYVYTVYKGDVYHGHGGTTLQNSTMKFSQNLKFALVTNVNEQNKGAQGRNIEAGLLDVLISEMPNYSYEAIGIEEEQNTLQVMTYPNPADGAMNIVAKGSQEITLFDLRGREIFSTQFTDRFLLNNRQIQAGIYIAHFTDKQSGITQTRKIIFR